MQASSPKRGENAKQTNAQYAKNAQMQLLRIAVTGNAQRMRNSGCCALKPLPMLHYTNAQTKIKSRADEKVDCKDGTIRIPRKRL
jgi:hypothetical protein